MSESFLTFALTAATYCNKGRDIVQQGLLCSAAKSTIDEEEESVDTEAHGE